MKFIAATFLLLVVVGAVPQTPKQPQPTTKEPTQTGKHKEPWLYPRRLKNTPAVETKSDVRLSNVPPAAIASLRQFLTFVFKDEPNLAKDKNAQGRVLSANVRDGIDHLWQTYTKFEKDNPGIDCSPRNEFFVGFWDYPTTYSIVGARRYDNRVVIDVRYRWGEITQYAGDKELVSYILLFEDGAWKLTDIYYFAGEFIPASTLSAELARDYYEC